MLIRRHIKALAAALSIVAALMTSPSAVFAQGTPPAPPTPIGAWVGIARVCTTGSRFQPPPGSVNQSVCREACLGSACAPSVFPIDEVLMLPTLLADGTVLATDGASLLDGHSTAQGHWEFGGKVVIDGKAFDRYQATFVWFQGRNPPDVDPQNPLSRFLGVVRPRFVVFFDPTSPDVMQGFIQPYLFPMTDSQGILKMQPASPFPAIDPMGNLPVRCDPGVQSTPACFGTLMFTLRRILAH